MKFPQWLRQPRRLHPARFAFLHHVWSVQIQALLVQDPPGNCGCGARFVPAAPHEEYIQLSTFIEEDIICGKSNT